MSNTCRVGSAFQIAAALLLTIGFHTAHAVPSFAAQTGLPYQSCHTVAPERGTGDSFHLARALH
jgi:hypothetical protein